MYRCAKCNSDKMVKKLNMPTKCYGIICLDCGYVEFYAEQEDLDRFKQQVKELTCD